MTDADPFASEPDAEPEAEPEPTLETELETAFDPVEEWDDGLDIYPIIHAPAQTLTGTDDADTLEADLSDDTIFGGAGNDYMTGNMGNDTLFAEDSNDTLLAGAGDDVLAGGWGEDVIDDFNPAEDLLAITYSGDVPPVLTTTYDAGLATLLADDAIVARLTGVTALDTSTVLLIAA